MADSGFDPERIERIGDSVLKVRWRGGHESLYSWPVLRAACPCAACRESKTLSIEPSVHPLDIRPVGRYAMAVRWSDGHATGIFSHEYLRSLCSCEECRPKEFTEG